jgi:hypothetical protein
MPTREELLHRMGINDPDFRDYLRKHVAFLKSLNSSQRKFHEKNTQTPRSVDAIAKSLGPDVTHEHIKNLFEEAPPVEGMAGVSCCSSR